MISRAATEQPLTCSHKANHTKLPTGLNHVCMTKNKHNASDAKVKITCENTPTKRERQRKKEREILMFIGKYVVLCQ